MPDTTGFDRVRAPLSDADRDSIHHARKQSVRDEVLDVVVERLARVLGAMPDGARPALSITEVFPDAWKGCARPASVQFVDSPGVLARIG